MPPKAPPPADDRIGQTVYLSPEVHDRLQKKAASEKRSFTAQAAVYIEKGLDAEGA